MVESPMSLNIKNEEAHELARELSAITGESLTAVVVLALRERLERIKEAREEDLAERIIMIARDAGPRFRGRVEEDPAAFLYDDLGLPR